MAATQYDSGWNPEAVDRNAVWQRTLVWNSTTNQYTSEILRLWNHPTVRGSHDFTEALTMLVSERDHLKDKLESLAAMVPQRDAAVEALKILIGVIESDPEFASVDSTKHCVDAARQLMKSHGLWEIDTDHVQEQV